MVSSKESSAFLDLLAARIDLGVRLAGFRGDERLCKSALFTLRKDGASEINPRLLKYDPLSKTLIWVGLAHPCPCLEPGPLCSD